MQSELSRIRISKTFLVLLFALGLYATTNQELAAQFTGDEVAGGISEPVTGLFSTNERCPQAANCDCTACEARIPGNCKSRRSAWEDRGIAFEGSVSNFFQGTASGGLEQNFEYGGHGDYDLDFDLEKLWGMEGIKVKFGSEHRFANSVNALTGSVVPVELRTGKAVPKFVLN